MSDAPNRIRELRMAAGLSQQKLADRIGVSKMTISELERGGMRLGVHYLRRLADGLGVAATDMLPIEMNPDGLSNDERALFNRLRAADPNLRDQLYRVADALLKSA